MAWDFAGKKEESIIKTKGDELYSVKLWLSVLIYVEECKDKDKRREVSRPGIQSYIGDE